MRRLLGLCMLFLLLGSAAVAMADGDGGCDRVPPPVERIDMA
jgi:hypothetical protein